MNNRIWTFRNKINNCYFFSQPQFYTPLNIYFLILVFLLLRFVASSKPLHLNDSFRTLLSLEITSRKIITHLILYAIIRIETNCEWFYAVMIMLISLKVYWTEPTRHGKLSRTGNRKWWWGKSCQFWGYKGGKAINVI